MGNAFESPSLATWEFVLPEVRKQLGDRVLGFRDRSPIKTCHVSGAEWKSRQKKKLLGKRLYKVQASLESSSLISNFQLHVKAIKTHGSGGPCHLIPAAGMTCEGLNPKVSSAIYRGRGDRSPPPLGMSVWLAAVHQFE